jgi:sugar lactone lactonase YvrE
MNRAFLLLALTASLGLPGLLRSQTFSNGQNATGVIGQTSFTSGGSSNLANRLNSPRGTAFDPVNGKVYVVDSFNHRVLRFPALATGQAGALPEAVFGQANFTNNQANRGLAAPTDSTLQFPRAAFVDSQGRLWISDANNNRVLRFDNAAFLGNGAPASAVLGQPDFTSFAAGTTGSTLNSPHGLVVGPDDALWVADRVNHRVLRYNAVTSKANGASADLVVGQPDLTSVAPNQGGPAAADTLRDPVGVSLDALGNLWVGDSVNHRVLRYAAAGSIIVNGIAATQVLGQVNFVTVVSNRGAPRAADGLDTPFSVHAGPDGDVWVGDFGNKRVLRYRDAAARGDGIAADLVLGQPDFATEVPAASVSGMVGPFHIGPGPEGSLMVSDFDAHRVTRFDPVNVAPTIRVTGSKRITTSNSSIILRGTAADADGSVASVKATLNNKPATATGTTSWSLRSRLKSGRNQIKLRSVDDLGLSSATVTVTVTRR